MSLFSGKNLKEIRERKGLSQSQLAAKTGLHIVTIGYYEIDKREPKATQLKLLADALGVKMEAFFYQKGGGSRTRRDKKAHKQK